MSVAWSRRPTNFLSKSWRAAHRLMPPPPPPPSSGLSQLWRLTYSTTSARTWPGTTGSGMPPAATPSSIMCRSSADCRAAAASNSNTSPSLLVSVTVTVDVVCCSSSSGNSRNDDAAPSSCDAIVVNRGDTSQLTGLTCPSKARMLLPERKSHTRARASRPHVAANDPSGWKDPLCVVLDSRSLTICEIVPRDSSAGSFVKVMDKRRNGFSRPVARERATGERPVVPDFTAFENESAGLLNNELGLRLGILVGIVPSPPRPRDPRLGAGEGEPRDIEPRLEELPRALGVEGVLDQRGLGILLLRGGGGGGGGGGGLVVVVGLEEAVELALGLEAHHEGAEAVAALHLALAEEGDGLAEAAEAGAHGGVVGGHGHGVGAALHEELLHGLLLPLPGEAALLRDLVLVAAAAAAEGDGALAVRVGAPAPAAAAVGAEEGGGGGACGGRRGMAAMGEG
ncbi:hypothetical protein ACMD2_12207 [Ananas comosus]|uniref:Uncharacterized protein n=1 Tax=Ananas comosus TaxID=4615 RepID=A0A199V814_ANACO|nr:hypothetical protein ACMD2_12207 [Ananas comosus]